MKRVIGLKLQAIVLFVFLSLFSVGICMQPVDNPYVWDFGKVTEGEVVKHNFTLKNNFTKPLEIKDITTSCGCTVSKVDKKVILPGQSSLIEVKFDSKGYSGPVQQFVYLNTNNIDNPVIRYIIKAEVVKTDK